MSPLCGTVNRCFALRILRAWLSTCLEQELHAVCLTSHGRVHERSASSDVSEFGASPCVDKLAYYRDVTLCRSYNQWCDAGPLTPLVNLHASCYMPSHLADHSFVARLVEVTRLNRPANRKEAGYKHLLHNTQRPQTPSRGLWANFTF